MDFIDTYLAYTENTETCTDYKIWCAISAIASSLQRRVFLQLGHLEIFPNMYIALVGVAGKSRKGTAITPYRKLLEDAGITICSESITTAKLINRLQKAGTIEDMVDADGTAYLYNHSSLTLIAPELSVFMGYQDSKFLANLADWWDSNRYWRYDTISRGEEVIEGVWFNFLGGITPALLQNALPQDAVGGGLLSRMILVYSDTRGKIIPFPEVTPYQLELRDKLLAHIEDLTLIKGAYTLSESTKRIYKDWRMASVANPPFKQASLIGYNERRAVHLLKLCIIMNASRKGNRLITNADFDRALRILMKAERGMPMALRGVGLRDDGAVVAKIVTLIQSEGLVEERKLYDTFLYEANKQLIAETIEQLLLGGNIKRQYDEEQHVYFKWVGV